jgi:hypothetical protein
MCVPWRHGWVCDLRACWTVICVSVTPRCHLRARNPLLMILGEPWVKSSRSWRIFVLGFCEGRLGTRIPRVWANQVEVSLVYRASRGHSRILTQISYVHSWQLLETQRFGRNPWKTPDWRSQHRSWTIRAATKTVKASASVPRTQVLLYIQHHFGALA